MKRLVFVSLFFAFVFVSCNDENLSNSPSEFAGAKGPRDFRVPGEFETQSAVWLAAPTVDYKEGWSMVNTQAEMIKELITSVKVYYSINGQEDADALRMTLLSKGVSNDLIDSLINFHTVEHGDLWVRDTGGIFMTNGKGEYQVVDFDFDAYRMKNFVSNDTYAIYQIDNDVSHLIAASLHVPVVTSPLVAEGGNFHFNGKGTVIAVEKSLLESNPGMNKNQIIAEIKRVFNVKKVILIPKTLPTDAHPVTESPYLINEEPYFNLGVWHIDEMVTWKDSKTVFLPQVSPAKLADGDPLALKAHEALEAAYDVLSKETDQDGNKLTIIRTPEPAYIPVELTSNDLMYLFLADLNGIQHFPVDGTPVKFILAASYMNYVITNDVILVPKLYKPGRDASLISSDEEFKQIMETHFPGRRVVQIDVDAIAVGGGGMHCITQQVPQ